MSTKGYTVLGWIVWQIGTRVAKRKIEDNRVKLGAGAALAALVVVGAVAAKVASGGEE